MRLILTDLRTLRRRSGTLPGRRPALGLVVAALVSTVCAGTASANSTVVDATIYEGSQGTVSSSISLSTLSDLGCPLYPGDSPIYVNPGDAPFTPVVGSSWAVSTILTCALKIPSGDVTQVDIRRPNGRGYATLSASDLSVPSPFQDPNASPVVSHDGNADQTTYARPARRSSDPNGYDHLVENGPITMVVFENGALLKVGVAANKVSSTSRTQTDGFVATVTDAAGATVQRSGLSWSWSFGDGGTSSRPMPTHTYTTAGVYPVTATVTDHSAGSGGTDTIALSVHPSGHIGNNRGGGAGKSPKSKSPVGSTNTPSSHGQTPNGNPQGNSSPSTKQGGHGNSSGGGAATTPATTTPVTPTAASTQPTSATTTPTTTSAARSSPRHRGERARPTVKDRVRPRPVTTPAGTLVSGRLISYVTSLPPSLSPLVHATPASAGATPTVRPGIRASLLPRVLAGLAVLALLGLGAARELRGRGGWLAFPFQ